LGRRELDVDSPNLLEGTIVKTLLQDDRVETWRKENPQQWWALQELEESDDLHARVLAAVLGNRPEDPAIDDLHRFAEALEGHHRATRAGTVTPPPGDGERRSFPITVTRMTRMKKDNRLCFRVDFRTTQGWSGFFDTTNPDVVERISKIRTRATPITVVGEVTRRLYEFLVELDARVRIV
jgi:hypothetical protein